MTATLSRPFYVDDVTWTSKGSSSFQPCPRGKAVRYERSVPIGQLSSRDCLQDWGVYRPLSRRHLALLVSESSKDTATETGKRARHIDSSGPYSRQVVCLSVSMGGTSLTFSQRLQSIRDLGIYSRQYEELQVLKIGSYYEGFSVIEQV